MNRIKKKIGQAKRHELIQEALRSSDELSVEEIAKLFDVSHMTVHRDLAHLESKGLLIRTHGGAVAAKRITFEFRFHSKQQRHLEQKRMIAAKALTYIADGQTIILDTGTTTLEIARQLAGKRNVKVITTSLSIVSELQFSNTIELILLGGHVRDKSPDLCGPLTEQNLELFSADIAFIGADAIDSMGAVYTDDLRVLAIDRIMSKIAQKKIVVADSSKFSRRAACKVFNPKDYDILITDAQADGQIIGELKKSGTTVEIVN